ncbi:hypothetical protein [Curtobacterium herbarum]|uniref:Sugar ABC transporter ATPase n=1 Tax=Curtobacterium herbarum TaxID=150122 RepID=A0ABN1ZAS7_9MICO|nr:hypothetical protein [Curtobacterium herbarum]MBM7475458.1 hypothetical protein [Curtobacterium herbarum]MCS6543374.1 hypothetical protein [Curtobacterium herbarum]
MTDAQNDQAADPTDPADAADATPHEVDEETLEPLSHDTQSGEADYVATSPGGSGTERHVPLPEEEQGRGTEYDPVDQGPQQEGQGG